MLVHYRVLGAPKQIQLCEFEIALSHHIAEKLCRCLIARAGIGKQLGFHIERCLELSLEYGFSHQAFRVSHFGFQGLDIPFKECGYPLKAPSEFSQLL